MDLKCKKSIVQWIMNNPGFVYSLFTFVPQSDDEVLPSEEEFEALTYNFNDWVALEEADLDDEEQEMYHGATRKYKYKFKPLNSSLIAHVFTNKESVLYVVVTT